MSQILTLSEFGDILRRHFRGVCRFKEAETVDEMMSRSDAAQKDGLSLLAAYDAALARIAELESPAHRAKVVREFEAEVDAEWFGESSAPSIDGIRTNVLARWEAAAKEGE